MTTPEFVMDTMREMDCKYFTIHDPNYRLMYQSWQNLPIEQVVGRFKKFVDSLSTNTLFRVTIYESNERLKNGEPKHDGMSYEVMKTDSLRDAPQESHSAEQGMGGFDGFVHKAYNAGSMGAIDLDRYLSSKDEILGLKLQIQQLQNEIRYLQDKHNMELQMVRREYEDKLSSDRKIEGVIGAVLPHMGGMFGMGGNGINGINGVEAPASPKEKVLAAINELMKLDPDFVNNITALAELAKSKPMVYKMAVQQLKNF